MLPPRDSGCVRAPKLRVAEIRLPSEGLWLPALTLAALPDAILVATFAELVVGTLVDVALPDPDGPIIADGVVASVGAHGTRIVFYDVGPELRERLDEFSRRGLLFDEPFSESALDAAEEREEREEREQPLSDAELERAGRKSVA